jgi:hypothetical protein
MRDQVSLKEHTSEGRSSAQGILLGLPPLFVFIGSLTVRYLAGYQCGSALTLLLQQIAVALLVIELVVAIPGLFSKRFRSLAILLVLTLVVSALLSWPLEQLSWWLSSTGLPILCRVTG